jgi:hypothetical protein
MMNNPSDVKTDRRKRAGHILGQFPCPDISGGDSGSPEWKAA